MRAHSRQILGVQARPEAALDHLEHLPSLSRAMQFVEGGENPLRNLALRRHPGPNLASRSGNSVAATPAETRLVHGPTHLIIIYFRHSGEVGTSGGLSRHRREWPARARNGGRPHQKRAISSPRSGSHAKSTGQTVIVAAHM